MDMRKGEEFEKRKEELEGGKEVREAQRRGKM